MPKRLRTSGGANANPTIFYDNGTRNKTAQPFYFIANFPDVEQFKFV